MKTTISMNFRRSAVASAVMLALGSAYAQDADRVAQLTQPESSISLGIGHKDGEHNRFGQYNGLNDNGLYGLFNVSVQRLDTGTGTWTEASGRHLGLDSREARFEQSRQGDWAYFVDYNAIPRYSQYTAHTGLKGVGSANLQVSGANQRDVQLDTQRDVLTLGLDKFFGGNWDVQVRYRQEAKEGARVYGRGGTGGKGFFDFLAEPIDSTTRQIDASVAYTGTALQLTGGYYGSRYDNHSPALRVAGGSDCLNGVAVKDVCNSPGAAFSPMAMAPGNEAHQLYVTGGYTFTPTTRANFRVAYTQAKQTEAFVSAPSATVGANDLSGKIDTTLAQFGVTARPVDKLSLVANFRYEDKDDKTPIRQYIKPAVGGTYSGENEPRSLKNTTGKLEASYQLPAGVRLIGGVDYDLKKRNTSDLRSVSHRDEVEETTGKIELRRGLAEDISGAIAYLHSERDGSGYRVNHLNGFTVVNNAPFTNVGSRDVAPIHTANRSRDKVRLAVDWNPLEVLSFQLIADESRDDYELRKFGVDGGKARFYSLDANWQITDKYQLTGWVSREDSHLNQRTVNGAALLANNSGQITPDQQTLTGGTVWASRIRYLSDAFGVGLRAKPLAALDIGADFQLSDDRSENPMWRESGTATVDSLPSYRYKRTGVNLFATYALAKNYGVRMDLMHERLKTDDWTWKQWQYLANGSVTTDGTRLLESPLQKSSFIGISGYYKWW